MSYITGSARPATQEEVNREADRITREVRSTRSAVESLNITINSPSPGAVASELRMRGFDVQQLDGNNIRVAKRGGSRAPFFG